MSRSPSARALAASRDHRAVFAFAVANGLSLDGARREMARLKWRAANEASAAKDAPKQPFILGVNHDRDRFWWNRD